MDTATAMQTNQEEIPMTETSTQTGATITNVVNDGYEQRVISVVNPTQEEMAELCERVRQSSAFKVRTSAATFNFKKTKDKETGIETVRKPVELPLAYPSTEGILTILEEGGKGLELLNEAVEAVINSRAREIISDDFNVTAVNFPYDKCNWDYIANMPKATRRGGGIPKEVWEAFGQDYTEFMPTFVNRTVEQITNAVKIMQNRLTQVKTKEPVLNFLVEQLGIYAENAPNASDYTEVIEFLVGRADEYLNLSDEDLLGNL